MKLALLSLTIAAFAVLPGVVCADGYVPDSADQNSMADDPAARARALDSAAAEARPPAIERAEGEELAAAVGHFARARSLLAAAIREFDLGRNLANPDSILNSKEWRSDIISRAEDLERILAPQARASKFGVRYEAQPGLLNTEAK